MGVQQRSLFEASLLITSVLISQPTVYLRGDARLVYVIASHTISIAIMLLLNYTYSTVTLSAGGFSSKFGPQVFMLLEPVKNKLELSSCSSGPAATYFWHVSCVLQHEILVLVVTQFTYK